MNVLPSNRPPLNSLSKLVSGREIRRRGWMVVLAVSGVFACIFLATSGSRRPPQLSLTNSGPTDEASSKTDRSPISNSHPLTPALDFARRVAANLRENVHDYTATVLKQERVGGQLGALEVCFVKIRQKPFSAYMDFLAPPDLKGQEALYVEGANNGNLLGHAGSGLRALAGTVQIPPAGPLAMMGQRYPITELGIANLTRRLIEVGEHDEKYGECYVWMDKTAMVGNRSCTSITVMHPVKRPAFIFYIARIFVDNELLVPVHYEAYDWPTKQTDPPILLERYTYANLKLNPGLTDADFDPKNPTYHFGLK